MNALRDGWLLATGTLTAVRVPPPSRVDRSVAGAAMALAPLAVLPLGITAAIVVLLGDLLDLPPLATAYAVVLALALGSRALHWDGLADTADGLTASYSPTRSLEVMRTGAAGPAGVVAIVLVTGLQAAALLPLVRHPEGWLAVGLLVCASRACLPIACLRGVPAARADGLGAVHIGSVSALAAGASLLLTLVAVIGAGIALGSPGTPAIGLVLMLLAVVGLLLRCVRRLGGITGDVLGAAVEVSLTVLLLTAATV